MSISGGQILHQGGKFVLDRIQTGGPGDLNIPEEKIYELGNKQSVATIRDIPEISFDVESYDMSAEFEALIIGEDPTSFSSSVGSNDIDFRDAIPLDIISPWKSRKNAHDIIKGVITPYLTLENATYRFGVGENSTQSFTFRGDSIFYTPGQPWLEEFPNTGAGPYTLENSNTATLFDNAGDSLYVLSVCLFDSTSKAYKRLFYDSTGNTGYLNTSTSVTLYDDLSGTYDTVRITYGTDAGTFDYDQTGQNFEGSQLIHPSASVKPAAIRGKDIEIYLASADATTTFTKFTNVQNVEATWSVTLENDEELGNERYVDTDYDVPEVSGSIGLKPYDPADLFSKVAQITGVDTAEVIGPNTTVTIPMEILIKHPDSGDVLKTLYTPDARFTVPGYSGQANAKLETSMNWSSDSGVLYVYNGERN